MTMMAAGRSGMRGFLSRLGAVNSRFGAWFNSITPKGLYPRSLLIIVMPMVLLQSVVAFVFMERHYNSVTRRLSAAVSQDIAAVVALYSAFPTEKDAAVLRRIAWQNLQLTVDVLPPDPLPAPSARPFFSILDGVLSRELSRRLKQPYWMDTVGRSDLLEVRIKMPNAVLRVFASRGLAYASNSHIFLLWMVGTSLVLLAVAILFLRNQIRPIVMLADAAEAFGKGRDVENFRPRGAREVRRAAVAFLEMKRRIERQIEQRTTMLAGVSHDMRTILTRFRLELAFLPEGPEVDALRKDVDELQGMLEAYLAFARGDPGEQSALTDMAQLIEDLRANAERSGAVARASFLGPPLVEVKADSLRRCIGNLVGNAVRYAKSLEISGTRDARWLIVNVDDDGPGIPAEKRDEVFRPFLRLDDARNQDAGGSGLGLSIARDIARAHGGDIILSDSPMGGLRATLRLPV
ncbi:two-component sensor histidine kinase [Aquabacter sp. L1I39]|uniref:ATP-binding protein n=1 Tax=Aquabacter sp. L1I39 TaxID=2820278 RepID=UPI001ADCA013|nr:ATP-binding protein [Aquabacter sp. L1I39]QTL02294.1 two-component sensor histidine kinase [Aquabacter sp. L1I39]